MASKNYSYPRVTMSTVAKKHSHNRVNVPDTTILFAPLWTEKGPDDQVVKVHSLAEFIDIFGSLNEDFYNYNGQQALNVYNWLNNGGTLLVKRLVMGEYINEIVEENGEEIFKTSFEILDTKAHSKESNYYSTNSQGYTIDPDTGLITSSTVGLKVNNGKYFIYNISDIRDYSGPKLAVVQNINGYEYKEAELCYIKETSTSPLKLDEVELYDYITKHSDCILLNGVVYKDDNSITAVTSFDVTSCPAIYAKYHGLYYKDLELEVTRVSTKKSDSGEIGYFNFIIKKGKNVIEKFLQKTIKTYLTALSASEYISIDGLDLSQELTNLTNDKTKESFSIKLSEADNIFYSYTGTIHTVANFFYDKVDHVLSNRLETPIDIILDAGYPLEVKSVIADFIRNNSETSLRPDIIGIFDRCVLKGKLNKVEKMEIGTKELHGDDAYAPTNIALYEQYFTINDATFTGQNIYVTPTYFLSKLLPYNDNAYGIQYPTAGLRRGILDDALWVNKNPDETQKDTWFKARINYVEKSSREYAFMSQRTFDGSDDYEYTALSFLNNARVLEKMKKELEAIGRSYLHEFNDAVTIANMTVALNKYVSNWISNRTLSMGIVEVAQNEVSENALDINLTIKFTNTIEVINVSIVIE